MRSTCYICYRPIFLVSKSSHLSPNSRRFRFYGHLKVGCQSEKWTKNLTKIQCFDQDFQRNDLQNAENGSSDWKASYPFSDTLMVHGIIHFCPKHISVYEKWLIFECFAFFQNSIQQDLGHSILNFLSKERKKENLFAQK